MTVQEALRVLKQMPSDMQVELIFPRQNHSYAQSTPSSSSQFNSEYSPSGPYN